MYVGSTAQDSTGGYNGGGSGALYGGGGATDVRLIGGDWNNEESLTSRIMVAAGGGGSNTYNHLGGYGGTLTGGNGSGNDIGHGGSQISGGNPNFGNINNKNNAKGKFGSGGNGTWANESLGEGGSGYYGGSSGGGRGDNGSGGGGSSYISGHEGCIAIKSSEDITPVTNAYSQKSDSYHYSGIVFSDTIMYAGNESMPSYNSTDTIGNEGNGHIRITKFSNKKDTTPPVINELSGNVIKASDNESGIKAYYYSTSNAKPLADMAGWIEVLRTMNFTKTIKGLERGKTYYVWVRDANGNINEGTFSFVVDDSDYDYTGNEEKITLTKGTYIIECWGAQGGGQNGGKGAYTRGE